MMAWYSGTVPEAIAESKRSSKLFVVYISDDKEESIKMNAIWMKDGIKSICETSCVCLKLESNSVDCQQFAEIYPVVIIPITYCIGNNGTPIEILAGVTEENKLMEKLQHAVQKNVQALSAMHDTSVAQVTTASHPNPSSHIPPAVTSSNPTIPRQTSPPEDLASSPTQPAATPALYSDDDAGATASGEASPKEAADRSSSSTSEKVQELQNKIKQYREEKAAQSDMDQRKKEIARRTTGKQMQELKEKQTEMKRKTEIAERKKEAAEKKEALERVRAEIARDRAEKQKKYEKVVETRNAEDEKTMRENNERAQKESEEKARMREKIARIQFRFPDGSTLTRQYDSSFHLQLCYDDLNKEAANKLPREFELFTTVPSYVFGESDKEKSLLQLGLVPSVAVYIRPRRALIRSDPSQSSLFGNLASFLMLILTFPFDMLKKLWQFVSGSNAGGGSPTSRSATPPKTYDDNTKPGSSVRRRNAPSSGREAVRDGKMHRLHDVRKDDDDDTATWNGNSTQQM